MLLQTDSLKKTVVGCLWVNKYVQTVCNVQAFFLLFSAKRQKAAKEVEKEAQKLEQELYATKGVRIE